ncbi:alpha/beta fold hydrolase [Vibrio genomosp. F10 str. 9ZC157]|uniref:Lysophospholipase n=1 Tax=Vibrio genomosp. F10 str. ZF-129 TaxID=1187848 RepID=A0A1E5BIF6_9VIBR|nr:alpha/beta fold hydrolase [Vibrio genomosp. F10]OEE36268.1 lysophospholipase [Vibrio genomosp. F10 str. ZF-129]OEE98552.1 lysophospholipase [Vibrio genomosp. F10 str. 9ZC157]
MNQSSSIHSSYTQESCFEQAISSNISQLWQLRTEGYLTTKDRKKLYWCKVTDPKHTKAIVIVNGRVESAWKYQELFHDLFHQGYDIYSFDHRGQGMSDRLIDDTEMGYIEEFDDYINDMVQLVTSFSLEHYEKRYLLAHSMGGAVATRYLQTNPNHPFDAVSLSAPMFGIAMSRLNRSIALPMTQLMSMMTTSPRYAPDQKGYYAKPFEVNPLTQSSIRYDWFRQLYEDKPQLKLGGPTHRWVWQGLMATKQCVQQTRRIEVPLLLMQASEDVIVDNRDQIRFIKKLAKTNNQCALKIVYGSRHELLFEKDDYRNNALDCTLQFFAQH